MRSSQSSANPGELLFNHLLINCTTKKARIAAINKILQSPGGDVTVKAAQEYGNRRIRSFDVEGNDISRQIDKLYEKKQRMRDIDFDLELARLELQERRLAQERKNSVNGYLEIIRTLDDAIKEYDNENELNNIIELSKNAYLQQQTPRPQ